MTPLELRRDLSFELHRILEHMNFKNQTGEDCKINIIEQNLPIQKDDDDKEPFPYVLVRIMDGEIPDDESKYTVAINLIIGIYDDSPKSRGADIVLNIIQEIIERFRKNPILLKKYVIQPKVKWALQDDDTYPFYFGGIEMNWTVPLIKREGIL